MIDALEIFCGKHSVLVKQTCAEKVIDKVVLVRHLGGIEHIVWMVGLHVLELILPCQPLVI